MFTGIRRRRFTKAIDENVKGGARRGEGGRGGIDHEFEAEDSTRRMSIEGRRKERFEEEGDKEKDVNEWGDEFDLPEKRLSIKPSTHSSISSSSSSFTHTFTHPSSTHSTLVNSFPSTRLLLAFGLFFAWIFFIFFVFFSYCRQGSNVTKSSSCVAVNNGIRTIFDLFGLRRFFLRVE